MKLKIRPADQINHFTWNLLSSLSEEERRAAKRARVPTAGTELGLGEAERQGRLAASQIKAALHHYKIKPKDLIL